MNGDNGTRSRHHAKRHPIRVVSRRTGVTRDLLRAWEARYGLLEPERSDGGQRLYSDADIERLRLIQRALEAGRRIGQVARLSDEDLRRLVEEDERARQDVREALEEVESSPSPQIYLNACRAAVHAYDDRILERELGRAGFALDARQLLDQVLAPLLVWLGDSWMAGRITPAHERLATAVIRRKLDALVATLNGEDGPVIVVATPSRQRHDLGAMLAAGAAAAEGWHVIYLGADLPAESIAEAAAATDARAVALSLIYPPDDEKTRTELQKLRRLLPSGTGIIVGGGASESYGSVLDEIGALWSSDDPSVRSTLDLVRRSHYEQEA